MRSLELAKNKTYDLLTANRAMGCFFGVLSGSALRLDSVADGNRRYSWLFTDFYFLEKWDFLVFFEGAEVAQKAKVPFSFKNKPSI